LVIGWDSAGIVEAVGAGVTKVKPGDRVMGAPDFLSAGAHASRQLLGEDQVAPLPGSVTYAQAATLPVAGLTAWQTLFTTAKLEAGQAVLIHAAAGAVGVLAIQLAKQAGAYVVATASSSKHDLVRSLGADQVIDYRTTSFEKIIRGMDVVLDTMGGDTQTKSYEVLKPGGYIVSTVHPPDPSALEALNINGSVVTVEPDPTVLTELGRRVGAGELRTVIDRTVPADDYRGAYRHSMTNRAQGKITLAWG
jgi:NADPH:quinone reductase-like Zn-dependent oxidoreductase